MNTPYLVQSAMKANQRYQSYDEITDGLIDLQQDLIEQQRREIRDWKQKFYGSWLIATAVVGVGAMAWVVWHL